MDSRVVEKHLLDAGLFLVVAHTLLHLSDHLITDVRVRGRLGLSERNEHLTHERVWLGIQKLIFKLLFEE